MIGTRIFKIHYEKAEIIEVKVGNHHFEFYILLVQRQKKYLYVMQLGWIEADKITETTLELNYGTPCIFKNIYIIMRVLIVWM